MEPCPFCKSNDAALAEEGPRGQGHDRMWRVKCKQCGSGGPGFTVGWEGPVEEVKQKAIDGWDRRARPAATIWQIWCEGYRITGNSNVAQLLAVVEAPTFRAACETKFFGDKDFNSEALTYWGCRLFDNELDARRAFG